MSDFTKETEHYIEHEVKLRLTDHKFTDFEKRMEKMDLKLNFIITIMLGTVILPAALKYLHWI